MAALLKGHDLYKIAASRNLPTVIQMAYMGQIGEFGSGAGKGGGGGGSIREAGGAFGKMEAAREEQYFRKLQKLQIDNLKEHLDSEILHHEHEMKRHEEAIERHKRRIKDLEK